jgi:hypothetical protein
MYLSAYHFAGDPALLAVAYERLISEFDIDGMLLQACAVGEAGDTVIDACPDRATYQHFVASPEFRNALAKAGLPQPRVEALGEVAHAYVHPFAVTLVGTKVAQ